MQEKWKPLDLRKRSTYGPQDEELIVLRFFPKDAYSKPRYRAGKFITQDGKSWFVHDFGTENIAERKRRNTIDWCRLPTE